MRNLSLVFDLIRILGSSSDYVGNDEGLAVFAGQHRVGFGVVDERLGRGVNLEFATQPIGDVAQVAERARLMTLFNIGGQHFGVTLTDGLEEVIEVVAAARSARTFFALRTEVSLPGRVAGNRQDTFGSIEPPKDGERSPRMLTG